MLPKLLHGKHLKWKKTIIILVIPKKVASYLMLSILYMELIKYVVNVKSFT